MKSVFRVIVEPHNGMGIDTDEKASYCLWEAISDAGLDNAASITIEPLRDDKQLLDFIRDVADNYDCDEDAHRYGTRCRCCEAQRLLNDYKSK